MNRSASILALILFSPVQNSWGANPLPEGMKATDPCDALYQGAKQASKNGAETSTARTSGAAPKNVRELKHGDHVYLYYKCKNCQQHTISSPLMDGKMGCAKCGAPRTNEEFLIPSQDDLLKEEQLMKTSKDLEIAKSGRAWNCSYCTGSNYAIYSHCRSCGAPRAADAAVKGAQASNPRQALHRLPLLPLLLRLRGFHHLRIAHSKSAQQWASQRSRALASGPCSPRRFRARSLPWSGGIPSSSSASRKSRAPTGKMQSISRAL